MEFKELKEKLIGLNFILLDNRNYNHYPVGMIVKCNKITNANGRFTTDSVIEGEVLEQPNNTNLIGSKVSIYLHNTLAINLNTQKESSIGFKKSNLSKEKKDEMDIFEGVAVVLLDKDEEKIYLSSQLRTFLGLTREERNVNFAYDTETGDIAITKEEEEGEGFKTSLNGYLESDRDFNLLLNSDLINKNLMFGINLVPKKDKDNPDNIFYYLTRLNNKEIDKNYERFVINKEEVVDSMEAPTPKKGNKFEQAFEAKLKATPAKKSIEERMPIPEEIVDGMEFEWEVEVPDELLVEA